MRYAILLLSTLLIGCGGKHIHDHPLELAGPQYSNDVSSVYWVLETFNENAPEAVLTPIWLMVSGDHNDPKTKEETYRFDGQQKPYQKSNNRARYVLGARLPPGNYVLTDIFSLASIFLGHAAYIEMYQPFTVYPNEIAYGGRITVVNRKAEDGERKSGAIGITLIDLASKSASGTLNSAMDIAITNHAEEDVDVIKSMKITLEDALIVDRTMPPYEPFEQRIFKEYCPIDCWKR